MLNTRSTSEGPDVIPSENTNLQSDIRFSGVQQTVNNNLTSYEKEPLSQGHLIGSRSGYDRPLGTIGQASTNVGYAQTPIGHGTHPITPTSPIKSREYESHLPTTSGFATTSSVQSGIRTAGQPIIAGGSAVGGVHEQVLSTNIRPVGPAVVTDVRSELKTAPIQTQQIAGLEGNISEIRPTVENSFTRQGGENSPNQQSRWEAQHADQSSMRYENHQVFENWESNRHSFVTDRINIMDDLLAGMDKKLDWLETGVHKVIQFFKERLLMEEKYSKVGKHHLPSLGEHFEKVDDPVLFSNFSKGMKENDAFHAQDRRNSEILANFIRKDILDWILIPCENDYKLQSKTLKNPMKDFKRRLDHAQSSRNKAYQKYFKNYDTLQRSSKMTPNDNNIFQKQLKYSLQAREELRLLKLYDEQGLLVISEFTRLATLRMNEIQRAFSLYLQKYLELYSNSAPTPEPILELVESSNGAEAVQSLFLPKNLLTYNNYEFLKRQFNRQEINYNDLTTFLVNFPDSIDPARSAFITREFDCVKMGGTLGRNHPCMVLATNSNNLLVVEKKYEDHEDGKVKKPFNLRFTNVDKVYTSADGTGTIVSILERHPGGVFHSNSKAKLKFETNEEAQSFLEFLGSKTNTAFDHSNIQAGNYVTSQSQIMSGAPVGLNTSNMGIQGTTSQYVSDPLTRSLGNQIQTGQIISSHVISERPILTSAQPINVQQFAQPIVSQTILKSEPITTQTISQTVTREANLTSNLGASTSTAKFVGEMAGDV